MVVFFPPDSILPQELIEKYSLSYMKKGERIQTVKLRGVVSQGLILPYDCLPLFVRDTPSSREGAEVSKFLNVTKWVTPEPTYSVGGGNQISKKKINPLFDKYTDIENIKNFKNIFQLDDVVVVTEKIHGSNARFGNLKVCVNPNASLIERISAWFQENVFGKTHQFVYGSHNVQITSHSNRNSFYGEDVWGAIGKKYNLSDKIRKDEILYGELAGEGIQDLTYGIDGHELYVFDIMKNGKYLSWSEVVEFCDENDLKTVPILYVGRYYDGILENYTDGKSKICPNQIREGIVIKMFNEENHPRLGRKILKSVSADYLTRKNATEFK